MQVTKLAMVPTDLLPLGFSGQICFAGGHFATPRPKHSPRNWAGAGGSAITVGADGASP